MVSASGYVTSRIEPVTQKWPECILRRWKDYAEIINRAAGSGSLLFACKVYRIFKILVREQQRLGSDCADAQSDPSLCCSHEHRGPLLSNAVQDIEEEPF